MILVATRRFRSTWISEVFTSTLSRGVYYVPHQGHYGCKKDAIDTIRESREIMLPDTRPGFFKGLFQAVLRVFAPLL